MKIKNLFFAFLGVLLFSDLTAQERKESIPNFETRSRSSLSVTTMSNGVTAQQMVETILGQGITYSNVQYTGAQIASGQFSGGNVAGIGIGDGIVLSNGAATNAIGPNDLTGVSLNNGLPGDPDLNGLGYSTNDASVLQFDFIPETSNLSFSFVMGSEEYPEWINEYPDVFGFFVNGVNIAFVPGTTIPISIGTINHEQNSEYYISNTPPIFDIQCDGFTVEFQLFATVTPNQINHIKLAVADANDYALDTWIFLKSSSFVGVNLPPVAQGLPAIQPIELVVGESYNLTFSFLSPETNQITNVVVNDFGLSDFNYNVTSGNICTVSLSLLATLNNVGNHAVQFIATDNGIPSESTTVSLAFVITNPLPNIVVNPTSLSESLYPNETSTQILTISNTGEADLNFDLEDVETSKSLKIKSVKPSGNGDNPDDFIKYLNSRIKDGVKAVSWLSETPLNGVIQAGESIDVEVAFDATGLVADMYNAQILINSNDPDQPQLIVPVSLEVLGTSCVHFTTDDNENNLIEGVADYDMDNYLFNYDVNVPIEFNIFIQEEVIESAQLTLYAFDVDETGASGYLPERDEIYVNGNLVGTLTGANDEWSSTVLSIDPGFLVPGPDGKNLIQIFVNVLYPPPSNVWAVQIDWGQLIINNCMGENAYIRYVNLDKAIYLPAENVSITVEVDTYLPTQQVIIETNLLDENMVNVAGISNTRLVTLNEDEPLEVTLPIPNDALMGATYHAQVIVYDALTYLQEDLALVPFLIWDGNGLLNCMEPGWQLISSYINPTNPDIEVVLQDLVTNEAFVIIINRDGFYWPSQNINLLDNWNVYSGYKIKMTKPDCLIIDGEMPVSKTVNLTTGVNYLPVLDDQNVVATDIFNQISGQMLFAFDILNNLVYWPAGGLYTLQTLEPGKGYLVSMTTAASVTYPETVKSGTSNNNKIQVIENSPWTVENTGVGHIISIEKSALSELNSGDIVAAFNSSGLCVGVTQLKSANENLSLVVFGDDFTTSAVDGMIENEAMTFKVYDASNREVSEVNPVWNIAMPNADQFIENGLSAITSLKASTSIANHDLSYLRISPNPSNGLFNIIGINESVIISVLNTTGQILDSFNADKAVEVDLSRYAKGIYYLKIVSGNSVRIEKVIVK